MYYHPDRNNGDKLCEEKFKAIQSAYENLSSSFKKQLLDDYLNGVYNYNHGNNTYYNNTSQQTSAEPVFETQKKKTTYYPYGFILLVVVWIMRAISNSDSPQVTFDNVKFTYQTSPDSVGSEDAMMKMLTGTDTLHETSEKSINPDAENNKLYFTIGSSKELVIKAQGYPFKLDLENNQEIWHYNKSFVVIQNGFVTGYSNIDTNLYVIMLPHAALSKYDKDSFFSIGSTKDQVLALQATPVSVSSPFGLDLETWTYQNGNVTFRGGIVASFINNGELHVK